MEEEEDDETDHYIGTVGLLKDEIRLHAGTDPDDPVYVAFMGKLYPIVHCYPSFVGGKRHFRIVADPSRPRTGAASTTGEPPR
jgi:hypothetical protein